MYCPSCGNNNEDTVQFCYNCGTRLTPNAASPSSAGQMTQVLSPATPPPPPPLASLPSQPMTYTTPSYGAPAATNSVAIASLVLGIVSWIIPILLPAIAAIICGHIARGQIRRSNGAMVGDKLALAGLILGYVQVGLAVVAICAFIALVVVIAVA